jgi:hypothetical protein
MIQHAGIMVKFNTKWETLPPLGFTPRGAATNQVLQKTS